MPKTSDFCLDEAAEFLAGSMKTTLNSMFNVEIAGTERGAFRKLREDDYLCTTDLIQDGTCARLRLSFDRQMMQELVARVFPAEDLQDDSIYESAAREVANVVGSNLKTFLNERGYDLAMGIPTVLSKRDFEKNQASLENFIFMKLPRDKDVVGLSFNIESCDNPLQSR